MIRIGFLLLLLIVLFCPNASAATDKYETLFQKKANLIVNTLANNPKIPSQGDREKYAWPAVIARLKKDYNDPWAKEIVKQFTMRESGSFYTNRDAFGAPGITRLIYLNRSQTNLNSFEKNYLKFLFAPQPKKGHYNFWQSGGTENFINMLRTSGYLLAMRGIELHIPEAFEKMKYMEKWLLQKAKKTYKMGVAEWDSSTYTTFNLIGWLNLYDFAKDEKIKKAAQAVLDYYASTIALKYTYGIYGGAEQRGGGALESFHSHTDYLAWLWFSEEIPKDDKFLVWPTYIQTIHGATSSYRPPKEAIALARKKFNQEAYYQNAKANYSLSKLEFPEFFYIGKTYTLGSAIVEDGGQIVNWKLVSYPKLGKSTQSITGGNSYKGVGKTVYDRYLQSKNILIQMTYISPELRNNFNLQKLRSYFDVFLSKIPCGKSCQFILKRKLESFISLEIYPVEDINDSFPVKNYITYPKNNRTQIKEGRYFIQTNQTYLAILPFSDFKLSQQVSSQKSRAYLENKAKLGQLTGFVIEVGNSFDQGSFENFQNLIIQKTKLNLSNINDGKITYQDINGSLLEVNYQFQNIFPTAKINNQEINLKNLNDRLYDGNNLQVKNYRLRIQDSESVYEVDYRGDLPIFTRNKR